jgi:hypothetical protein
LMEGIPRSNLNNEMDYCWAARFICKVISILYMHLYNWKRNHECGVAYFDLLLKYIIWQV